MVENKPIVEQAAKPTETRPQQRRPGPDRRPHNDRRPRRETEVKEYEERTVAINRVTKVVKGGKHMRFTAIVVIGNGKGKYGFDLGKAGEVPDAIKKALEGAKRNTATVKLVGKQTIAHEVIGQYGACRVFLKPAPDGTGIIAGGPVRAILELAGLKNVYSKVYGSRAPINIIRATHAGLQQIKTYEEIQALRGK